MTNRSDTIQVLTFGEPAYPALLQEIRNPPKTLYYIGDVRLLRSRCAAVVGSRTTTNYGRNTARSIGRCLAEHGVAVVSGMAAGIDTCAHEGALAARGNMQEASHGTGSGVAQGDGHGAGREAVHGASCGKTIAVLGCGPDLCYPAGNHQLKASIQQQGLVISEYAPGTQALPYHFPQRNRIISGLSELVVVVQARIRSGALITAELAAEQGREIYAVPGSIDSQYNLGTNQLIRDGAGIITAVEDVLEPLRLDREADEEAAKILGNAERQVYEILRERGELSADELCRHMDCRPGYLLPILSALELKGILRSGAGKFFLAKL